MNYPIWAVPSGGLLIAVVAIVHVFISHFAVGGGLFLVLAEHTARRRADAGFLGFVRSLSRAFVLLTLVMGALTGVAIWFTIALVSPHATSFLINAFVWGWAIEWTFFLTEIAAAMVYFYGWDRLTPRTHLAVGWIYAGAAWMSLAVINGILSYMLTSGAWPRTLGFWDGIFNPTYWPALALRTAVAVALAGLYAVFAASFVADSDVKARVAAFAGQVFVLPAAVAIPASLLWFLSAANGAGVPVGEALGARGGDPLALLQAVFGAAAAGQPNVRRGALATVIASILLAVGLSVLIAVRRRSFRWYEATPLMLLGLIATGGGEWVREGLRKPFVIDHVMFVNGIRLPAPDGASGAEARQADRFRTDSLARTGVLGASPWAVVPAAWRPGAATFIAMEPGARAAVEAEAGREVFRLQCSACHTTDGYLGIRALVKGKSVGALEKPLHSLDTWLGRRMPPFVGTDAERRAVAVYMARLGGDPTAGIATAPLAGAAGLRVFEEHCAACHGAGSDWPIAPRVAGRDVATLHDLIGRLPEMSEDMPPFEGSPEDRQALAEHLADLAASATPPEVKR